MKKLIFTFIAVVGFATTSSAQCGSQGTEICGDCYSIRIPLTGILSVDTANFNATGGTMLRKPNHRELSLIMAAVC